MTILKFVMLTSFCFISPNNGERCGQTLHDNIPGASQCKYLANYYGSTLKDEFIKNKASMTSYRAQCLAITQQGLDIDQTFEISYNIL